MSPELVDRARASIQKEQAFREAEKRANVVYVGVRRDCERLVAFGKRKKNLSTRIFTFIPPFTFLFLGASIYAKVPLKRTWWLFDERLLNAEVKNGGATPVEVKISADSAIPEKADIITVNVQGLDERLVLYKKAGHVELLRDLKEGEEPPPPDQQAVKWQEFIEALKKQLIIATV